MMWHLKTSVGVLAPVFLLTAVIAASAAEVPKEGSLDKRVRFVDYHPYQVTQIVGALLTTTQIEFSPDETVIDATIGDPVWEIAPSGNHVFLKVRERHPSTNLQIVTERPDRSTRSYQIELGVMPPALAAKNPPFFLVKYRYPSDEAAKRKTQETAAAAEREAGRVDQVLKRDETIGPRNFSYVIEGEANFEPSEVWDNGKITTMKFPANIEMPAIYAVNEAGKEELVPKSVNGDSVFVHLVAKKFTLRRGETVMCITNAGYVPGGIDPGTRTTSPSVARVPAPGAAAKKATNVTRTEPPPGLAALPVAIDPKIFAK